MNIQMMLGVILMIVGLLCYTVGIIESIDKKLNAPPEGTKIEVQTLKFNKGFTDEEGKEINPIRILTLQDIEAKE